MLLPPPISYSSPVEEEGLLCYTATISAVTKATVQKSNVTSYKSIKPLKSKLEDIKLEYNLKYNNQNKTNNVNVTDPFD